MTHPHAPAPRPYQATSDLAHGMALGQILSQLERLLFVSELHGRSLTELHTAHAELRATLARLEARPTGCPHPAPPSAPTGERMPFKEKMQLVVFLALLAAVALGKVAPSEAIAVFGKPFGF